MNIYRESYYLDDNDVIEAVIKCKRPLCTLCGAECGVDEIDTITDVEE